MSLLAWHDDYALGIAAIDHEHRELIELINALYAAVEVGASRDELGGFFAELHAVVAAHFALEERVMREQGYDELTAHKTDHERLLDEILMLDEEVAASGVRDDKRLAARLDDWFSAHFRSADARLHQHLYASSGG